MIFVSNDTTYPIFTNFLSFDVATRSLKPNSELFYEPPFGVVVAFFLLISAVAHFYLATIGYGSYVTNLKKGMNKVRFYEYALSSSLIFVLIGMLIGIWDLGAIILIFTVSPGQPIIYTKNRSTSSVERLLEAVPPQRFELWF